MTNIDVAQFKAVFPQLRAKQFGSSTPPGARLGTQTPDARKALHNVLGSFYQKAGLDVAELTEIAQRSREDARRQLEDETSTAAKQLEATRASLLRQARNRDIALRALGRPFLSYYEILPEPFLIWELPNPQSGIFVDSHIEEFNSYAKVLVDTGQSSDNHQFTFYFYWQNPSDYYALMNVTSFLILNGVCSATASFGFLENDAATISLGSTLAIWRWFGWGTDPATGNNLDQTVLSTNYTGIATVTASAFFSLSVQNQSFPYSLYNGNYSLLAVPPGASVLFEVGLDVSYGFAIGGISGDNIYIDFANNAAGREVLCREVDLEILVPLESLKFR